MQQTVLITMCASDPPYYSKELKYLIDHGTDVNVVDKEGLTALDYAVIKTCDTCSKYWDIIALLLGAGAEFGPKTSKTYDDELLKTARDAFNRNIVKQLISINNSSRRIKVRSRDITSSSSF